MTPSVPDTVCHHPLLAFQGAHLHPAAHFFTAGLVNHTAVSCHLLTCQSFPDSSSALLHSDIP